MEKFTISIAGFHILLQFGPIKDYPQLKRTFKKEIIKSLKNFIIPSEIKTHVTINIKDNDSYKIIFNNKKSFSELAQYDNNNTINIQYHISVSQFFMILSNLLTSLLQYNNGFMLHSSASLIDDKAHIFIGKEGVGKSTIIKLLRKYYPGLADDQVFIKKTPDGFRLYQNPYIEKTTWINKSLNSYKIGSIYTLGHAKKLTVTKLTRHEGLTHLLNNLLMPEKNKKEFITNLFNFYSSIIDCFELGFNLDKQTLLNYFKKNS